MSSAAVALELLARDSHMAVAGHGRLFVVATLQPPTRESLLRFRACMLRRYDEVGDSLLGVIIPAAPRPGLEAGSRETIVEVWGELIETLDACAVWIRRDSFVGALQRSLVTGVMMLKRPSIVAGVVATAAEAVSVLARAEPFMTPSVSESWAAALDGFAAEYAR